MLLFLAIFVMLIVTIIMLRPRQSPFKKSDRVLVVTAHPDDECMFFGPTLCHLADRDIKAKVVCLSKGNFYGLGEKRSIELKNAVQLYEGVEQECLARYKDALKDGPYVWPADRVATAVKDQMLKFKPTCIVTFDQSGVSGHRNHCSLSSITRTGPVRVLYLESVPLWRKFMATFDLGATFFSRKHYVVAGSGRSLRAMMCHRSQLEWFRFLYILFSRYMTINSFKEQL